MKFFSQSSSLSFFDSVSEHFRNLCIAGAKKNLRIAGAKKNLCIAGARKNPFTLSPGYCNTAAVDSAHDKCIVPRIEVPNSKHLSTFSSSVPSPHPSIPLWFNVREGQKLKEREGERERERELEQGPGTEWWSKHQWNFEPETASLLSLSLFCIAYHFSVSTILSLAISFSHYFLLSLTHSLTISCFLSLTHYFLLSFFLTRSSRRRKEEQQTWRSWFSEGR